MIPFYKIVVNENDDTGVDFNAFVDAPAHMKGFIAFGKDSVRYNFNDDKRIVTGVMISAGTPIYRKDKDFGEHYVIFDATTIDLIRKKFFKKGFNQNVNADHDATKVIKGATLIDSYIVSNSDDKLPSVPTVFEHMKLEDGSWIASYHVTDDSIWSDVKSGKFNGFSVEGWFDKVEISVKQQHKQINKQMKKPTIWESMKSFFDNDNQEENFAQATTSDGVVVMYEGELGEGSQLTIEADGEQVPAPEGAHELTLEDGTIKIVTLDGSGVVVSIDDLEEAAAAADDTEMRQEVAEALAKIVKDTNTRFNAIEKENSALKNELETIKSGEKFKANPNGSAVKGEAQKMTASEILKANKK